MRPLRWLVSELRWQYRKAQIDSHMRMLKRNKRAYEKRAARLDAWRQAWKEGE